MDQNQRPPQPILTAILGDDAQGLRKAQQSYGDSWKRRGGVGAFMMLARKYDRLENRCGKIPEGEVGSPDATGEPGLVIGDRFDIFEHARCDDRSEGIIDDIRDLRRYLVLVLAELMAIQHANGRTYIDFLGEVAESLERTAVGDRDVSRFGGVYEFMALADLWDNLEKMAREKGYDIFKLGPALPRTIAVQLLRIEGVLIARGIVHGTHRDNAPSERATAAVQGSES